MTGDQLSRYCLRGIAGFHVAIQGGIDTPIQQAHDQIRTEIESRLRSAGFDVFDSTSQSGLDQPWLIVAFTADVANDTSRGLYYLLTFRISVSEAIVLVRSPAMTPKTGETWSRGGATLLDASKLMSGVRRVIAGLVDELTASCAAAEEDRAGAVEQ